MLNTNQQKAIELLLSNTEQQTARELGVMPATVRRWLASPEFTRVLRDTERRQHSALIRIAATAALNAAITLATGTDSKTALEVIKLSKALELEGEDAAESLAEVVKNLGDDDD